MTKPKLRALPFPRKLLDLGKTAHPMPAFQIKTKSIKHKHALQLTFDHGETPGPWIKVGLNHVELAVGFLPL